MTQSLRPSQIVVAYDFSPSAEEAVLRAVEIACRAPQNVLHIVAAIEPRSGLAILPPDGPVDYLYAGRIEKIVGERMTAAFAGRKSSAEVQFYVHARIGHPANEILQIAEELGADLIMIGSHGKTGLERLVLGSVSERVVREAKCPVMVARAKRYADVELAHVIQFDHERQPYHPPHRYVYIDQRVLKRPAEWPIS
ncbi:hypothetical protein BH11MYX2_BH11MYX2_08540 [soil metagenome]